MLKLRPYLILFSWIILLNSLVSGALVSYYTFDQNGKDDYSTNNAQVNCSSKVTGFFGKAYNFSTTGDLINTGITNNFINFTFTAWIYPGETATGRIFEKRQGGAENFLAWQDANEKINFKVYFSGTDGYWYTGSAVVQNQWNFIAISYEGNYSQKPIILVNGVNSTLTSTASTGNREINSDAFIIGNRGAGDRPYVGFIDEVGVYSEALTLEELNATYNYGLGKRPFNTYYVSNAGSDTNNGLTTAAPFKTIDRLNNVTRIFGDTIYFNKGDIFRCSDMCVNLTSGTANGYINYTAYGSGNLPIITPAINASSSLCWELAAANLWEYNCTALTSQIGNIIVNSEAAVLKRNISTEWPLKAQGEYFYNYTADTVYIYSTSNPGTYYSNIELAPYITVFKIQGISYNIIENLQLIYSGRGGIGQHEDSSTVSNIKVNNCNVRFMGGGYLNDVETDRTGNCLSFSNAVNNITATNNNITECWDGGITVSEWIGSGYQGDINLSKNIIRRAGFGFEYFSTDYIMNNFYIEQNTVLECGWGFSGRSDYIGSYGQGDVRGRCFRITGTKAGGVNFVFRNNLIYNSSYIYMLYNESGAWAGEKPKINNSLYYGKSGLATTYFSTIESSQMANIAAHQTTTGFDANSLEQYPVFVSGTFRPRSASIACTMGAGGGYVGALPCEATTCAGPIYSMADNCTISSNVTTGNITFIETGRWTCNATISANITFLKSSGCDYFIKSRCLINGKVS